ncbi:hypothetical protein RN001_009418 [Aquatica leii]|uniref:Acyl-CoA-binding domain-containing protein 6 n=1 Tax=Aquatica leii TaxID=1421715 RepID=A0AAN7P595_9COLE|nr:hypothetical protein RN001_009418 [Aquatica leii]
MEQAATLENYNDLDELETDTDELTEEFLKYAERLKGLVTQLDEQTLLRLYGYYKQAMEGPCNTPRPNWFNLKGKAKWDAWMKLGKMNQNEAKKLYIELVQNVDTSSRSSTGNESWVSVSTMHYDEKALNESEKSIIDYVKEGNYVEVVRMLKSGGTDRSWNELDENGMGLIHWAADRGYSNIIQALLSHGADVNLRDAEMQTPLHYAAVCGHLECVGTLLKNNADVTLKDDDGFNPKDVAVDAKVQELFSS